MALSPNQKITLMAQEASDREVCLITMTHPSFTDDDGNPTPVYISTDPTEYLYDDEDTHTPIYGTKSNGKTYIYLPIQATLPSSESDQAPTASFSISNVSRLLAPYLLLVNDEYPKVTVDVVLASDTESIIQTWPEFDLTEATLDADKATLQISIEKADTEPSPWMRFIPAYFPNLF